MSEREKEVLLGKANVLYESFSDTQIKALLGIVIDFINTIQPDTDKPELGFTSSKGEK